MPLIKGKVGEFSIGEAFAVGISKALGERILQPFIGNGTLMSGGIKLAAAWGGPKFLGSNSVTRIVATGLAVDGVEDIIQWMFNGFGGASTQQDVALI